MKILILVNHDNTIYNFRKELIQRLIDEKHEIFISSPYGKRIPYFEELGCHWLDTKLDRHGINPVKDVQLTYLYFKLVANIKPDIMLTFTIKPNIYGGIVASINRVPFLVNITGLGTAFGRFKLLQLLIRLLYKYALRNADCVFFQNTANQNFFINNHLIRGKSVLLPGSGVNLNYFSCLPYPENKELSNYDRLDFAFISRVMHDKGIDEFLEAARYLKTTYPKLFFHVCGFCEEAYGDKLAALEKENIILYHGMVTDIRIILEQVHCVVLPSYHEGMSNALLEASASGRPIIASDIPGCREIVSNGINGYLCAPRNTEDLIQKMEKFIRLPYEEKKKFGISGRKNVELKFNREKVIELYLEEIHRIIRGE